jgi:hypothetical protein
MIIDKDDTWSLENGAHKKRGFYARPVGRIITSKFLEDFL